jgi:thioredoxin-related protein
MRALRAVIAAAFVAVLSLADVQAAREEAAVVKGASGIELLVFEHPDCIYCQVFRRDVLPRYMNSDFAARAQLRFVDIAHFDESHLVLKARIAVVPTAVLMKDGAEMERIVGYTGPDTFFKLLSHLLLSAD